MGRGPSVSKGSALRTGSVRGRHSTFLRPTSVLGAKRLSLRFLSSTLLESGLRPEEETTLTLQ